MAEATPVNQDLFTCPICLELLKDPVTLHCGHSYCMGCIHDCWNQEDQEGVYSCPQCRQTFSPRPVLNKNNIVAELVDQMRKTRIQTAAPAHAEHGDVECDVCTGKKLKAVKSCLECMVNYCDAHYKVHNDIIPGRKHKVVDATGQLQERICKQHQEPLKVFCRTDQSCVCYVCLVDEHKGHDTVSASAGRKEKQTQLGEEKRRFQQRIQEREKELQELRKAVETLKSSAQTAVEDSERIFTEMIRSIERRRSEVTELIRAQEKAEVSRAEGLLKRLEQEIANLKRRGAELEQLSHRDDHIYFLKTFLSVSEPPESKDTAILVSQSFSFEAVRKSIFTLQEQLENLCKQQVIKTSEAVMKVQTTLPSEPSTRVEFLQYACKLTLDPNTASRKLSLSEENRMMTCVWKEQLYPDHPERFDYFCQMLCREGLSGRCYWEAERSGDYGARIAVAYKSIKRKGRGGDIIMGSNAKSWSLFCSSDSYSASHNNKDTAIPVPSSGSRRVGVYLDWPAGTLCFYSVSSDTLTHLHTFASTFTEPLYPGFGLQYCDTSVSLCQIT